MEAQFQVARQAAGLECAHKWAREDERKCPGTQARAQRRGLAPTLEVLILARILQGVAGALLVPGSLAILTATFEGPARGRAFGLWAAATAALNLLGPIVGGILVSAVSWRAAFLINLPIGVVALWLTLRAVPESRRQGQASLDWLGAVVVGIAVAGLSFGAIRSPGVATPQHVSAFHPSIRTPRRWRAVLCRRVSRPIERRRTVQGKAGKCFGKWSLRG